MMLTLVRTKLNTPRLGHDFVHRPILVQRLNAGLDRDLTLVIAPAGFGKTTLVAEWASQSPRRVTWLSLDESDNDLLRLVDYLIAAIQKLFPAACPETQALIEAPQVPGPETLASVLINEIDDLPDRFALVLDDYHFVTAPAIHQLLDSLLRRPPLQLHLILASRSDPPLALPRLRANRAVSELRVADLRFSRQEAEVFLAQTAGVDQAGKLADALMERTEGWIAGLQLASLSLRAAPDAAVFAQEFARGRNRYIIDYLFDQVLTRQTPQVQAFLLKTSILDRLSPALAQAVAAEDDTQSLPVDLAALERAGLFLNALDETGEWYACHTLFRETLSVTLQKTYSPDEIATLHRRASRWFCQHGLIDEAVRHAVVAGDAELASQVIADNLADRLNYEDWHALERWLALLPAEWVETWPWLLVTEAYVLQFQSKWNAMLPVLKKAEQQLQALGSMVSTFDRSLLSGYAQALWSQHWIAVDEAELAKETAQQAIYNLPVGHLFPRTIAITSLCWALHSLGDFTTAESILIETLAIETPSPASHFSTRLLLTLAALYLAEGNIIMLARAAEQLRQNAAKADLQVDLAWAHMALGVAAYEANDLSHAAEYFAAGAALRHSGHTRAGHECLVGLALTEQARGRRDAAKRAVSDLLGYHRELANSILTTEDDSLQARLALAEGDLETARRWISSARTDLTLWWFLVMEVPVITQISVEVADRSGDDLEHTRNELEALLELATRLHKPRRMTELLALKALLHDRLNERGEALKALEAALALGEPRGLVRAIADAGPQLEPLLKAIASRSPSSYLDRILAALQPPAASTPSSQRITPAPANPLVSLTHREQDVLVLLGRRYTDREIAEALVISPLTVRYHIENLSAKLGVRGRRVIVARARELGLLSQN